MRGVCVDALNHPPSWRQLRTLGTQSVRVELRDNPLFYQYINSGPQAAYLIGPSTDSFTTIRQKSLVDTSPSDIIIIGNEPDGTGPSSWSMRPLEYIDFYNRHAPLITTAKRCVAGMINGPSYLKEVLPSLDPTPDYVNVHYPADVQELAAFKQFGLPVICGEWCWRTCPSSKYMTDWELVLEQYTAHSFYFCWADWMVPKMGLLYKSGSKTRSYHYYKEALA